MASKITYTRKHEPREETYEAFGQPKKRTVSQTIEEVSIDLDNLTDEQRSIWQSWQASSPKATYCSLGIIQSESPLTLDEAFAKIDAKNQEREAERQRREAEKAAQEAARQTKLAEAATIEWNENGKAIVNLYQKIHTISEVEFDHRFSNWIKRVDSVNMTKQNGYAFEGELIHNRIVEIDNENAVFMVAGTSGSRKYSTTHYRIIVMRGGKLESTDISTTNSSDRGWALIIRDRVAKLVNELGQSTEMATEEDPFAPLREAAQSSKENVIVSRDLLAKLLEKAS